MKCWYCKHAISKRDQLAQNYYDDGRIWCAKCLDKIGESPESIRIQRKEYHKKLKEFNSVLDELAKDMGFK